MTQMQTQLDNESRSLTDAIAENIKLKAAVDQLNTKCIGLESKVRFQVINGSKLLTRLKFTLYAL